MNKNTRFWLILVAVIVAFTVLLGGAGTKGPPLDPDSVSPDGARGIVEILEEFGVDVAIRRSTPRDGDTAVLLLEDRLTQDDRFELDTWIGNGGVLVVADPTSSYSRRTVGPLGFGFGESQLTQGICTIDALADVQELEVPGGVLLDSGGFDSCFGSHGPGSFVVAVPDGQGTVVSIGGPRVFANATIDEADAAVLAVSLLAPQPEQSQVTFLGPSTVDFGEEGLGELVAPRVSNSIYQLLAAFLLYGLFRMRRLGGVVAEPVPVVIEGSELVLQSGVLSERSKDPKSAGEVLRRDFLVRAHRSLGVPATGAVVAGAPPSDLLASMISERSDTPTDEVIATFTSAVTSEAQLLEMARQLETLEESLNP